MNGTIGIDEKIVLDVMYQPEQQNRVDSGDFVVEVPDYLTVSLMGFTMLTYLCIHCSQRFWSAEHCNRQQIFQRIH